MATPARTSSDQTDPQLGWTVQTQYASKQVYVRPLNPSQDGTFNKFNPQDLPHTLPPHVRYPVRGGNDVVVGRVND